MNENFFKDLSSSEPILKNKVLSSKDPDIIITAEDRHSLKLQDIDFKDFEIHKMDEGDDEKPKHGDLKLKSIKSTKDLPERPKSDNYDSKKVSFRDDQILPINDSTFKKNLNKNEEEELNSDYYLLVENMEESRITKDKDINLKPNDHEKIENSNRLSIKKKASLLPEIFHINQWSELQEKLKDEYNIMNLENETKENLLKEFTQCHKEYYLNYIKLREISETLKELKSDEEPKKVKILLNEDEENKIYSEAFTFAKSLVFALVSNPILLSKIIRLNKDITMNSENSDKCSNLMEVFSQSFFENITEDEPYELNQMKFISELIKGELDSHAEDDDLSSLFLKNSFSEKSILSYFKRNECQKYLKLLLEKPLLAVLKINDNLSLEPKTIEDYLKKKRKKNLSRSTSNVMAPMQPHFKDKEKDKLNQSVFIRNESRESVMNNSNNNNTYGERRKNTTFYYVKMFKEYEEANKPARKEDIRNKYLLSSSISKFLNFWNVSKIPNISKFIKKSKLNVEEEAKNDLRTASFGSELINSRKSNLQLKKSIDSEYTNEVEYIANERLEKIIGLLIVFTESIFENLYNMPVGIRIICKIIKILILKKNPNLPTNHLNSILANFLFDKWIIPGFSMPVFSGYYHDFTDRDKRNLFLIGGLIPKIFKQRPIKLEGFEVHQDKINLLISEIMPSIDEYYKELTEISDGITDKIFGNIFNIFDESHAINIRSVSICISLEDIQFLGFLIERCSDQLAIDEMKIKNYVNKLNIYNKEKNLYKPQENLREKYKILKPDQIFTLFVEKVFPFKLSINYLDYIYKPQNNKNLPEKEKILNKIKHILKQILISIDRVNNLSSLNGRKNITLKEILENYQERVYLTDSNAHLKSKEKIPLSLSSKFLLSILNKIDARFNDNNWLLIYEEMLNEYLIRFKDITEIVYLTKSQLLKAIENIKRNNLLLVDSFDRQKKLIKQKYLFTNFIKETIINVCCTSNITREKYKNQNTQEENSPLIIITNTKECVHDRFTFMKDLTSNAGDKKKNDENELLTHEGAHSKNIFGFIESFSNLPEVREVVSEGEDIYGVQKAFSLYLDTLQAELKESKYFKDSNDEEIIVLIDLLEKYITRRFYNRVFPETRTLRDAGFYTSLKVLDWISYDDLDILPRNRVDDMWEVAIQHIKNLDSVMTPIDKLKCFVDCFKTIVNVVTLTSDKGESAGADESLPIAIYVVLKAAPERLYSNINFINIFRNSSQKMLAQEGYSFIQITIAIAFIESLSHEHVKMNQYEFDRKVYEKEMEYEIYYLKDRKRSERSQIKVKSHDTQEISIEN